MGVDLWSCVVDVEIRPAAILRKHSKMCPACELWTSAGCPTATSIVEDALSMSGLFALDRTIKEKKP